MTDGAEASPRLRITADAMLVDGAIRPEQALLVDERGLIVAAGPTTEVSAPAGVEQRHYGGVTLPGAVNAHSHAFQILLRGRADSATDFRDWVDGYMYPLALAIDEDDLTLASTLGFAEMLLNGVTTVGEFFYVHNLPADADCAPSGNRNSEAVIAAARACGLRIHLLRCLYDQRERKGQRRFWEPAAEAVARTRELADRHAGDPLVSVGIAPHSLHGASADGIQAAADFAAEQELPFQIHIAEERHDLEFSNARYGTTPLRALERLGVLSERLCVVHGVWLDDEEIGMLGDVGGALAYNPISNMALGDGITDLEAMVRAGVTVALGCDGPCANHQVNVWQEMRFAEWLQRTQKLRMNVLPAAAGEAASARACLELGTVNGGRVLGLPVGRLAPGYYADLVVADPDDLSLLPHHRLDPTATLNNVVYSMAARGAIRTVVVGGDEVVRDGRLALVDQGALARRAARWTLDATTHRTPAPDS